MMWLRNRLSSLWSRHATVISVTTVMLLALGVRLMYWQWAEFRPLGGDEQEYLAQAVHWLQTRQYRELQFMRPPLYTVFLASAIVVVDSLVQSLRLVQVLLSASMVIPVYGLTWSLWRDRRVALVASVLVAFDALVASVASELLSETLFLWGMSMVLWGVVALAQSPPQRRIRLAIIVGVGIGALVLVRSVAMPLAALAGLWLWLNAIRHQPRAQWLVQSKTVLVVAVAAACVVVPWSVRNSVTYGGLIVVDTTGAENLWLDNEPQGREYAKTILYGMGDDRYGRQRLASANGMAVITAQPEVFLQKMRREAVTFFRLTGFDDFTSRRAIWVSPLEVWSTLILGDGMWLLLLSAGVIGLGSAPRRGSAVDWRWVVLPWLLYGWLTVMIFHFEPRYRFVIYPVLWSYAAWCLCHWRLPRTWAVFGVTMTVVGVLWGMTLRAGEYATEAWRLAQKHRVLAHAEDALARREFTVAERYAWQAQEWDLQSALVYTVVAQSQLLQHRPDEAIALLDTALTHVPQHPWAMLLRGIAYRSIGDDAAARRDFGAETSTRQDVQHELWMWMPQMTTPPQTLVLGRGADLGWLWGFYAPEPDGGRWSRETAAVRLFVPSDASRVRFRLATRRPTGADVPRMVITVAGVAHRIQLATNTVQDVDIDVPNALRGGIVEFAIATDTFRPRTFDSQSADGRQLGIWIDTVQALPDAEVLP